MSGHSWYIAPSGDGKRSVAVLLHQRWRSDGVNSNFHYVSKRVAYLDLCTEFWSYRLTTGHAPHAEHPDVEYEQFLYEVGQVVLDARNRNISNILCIDANAVVGKQEHADNVHSIGCHGFGVRNGRGHVFANVPGVPFGSC